MKSILSIILMLMIFSVNSTANTLTVTDSIAADTTGLPQGLSDKRKGELFLKEKAARKYFERETEIQSSKVDSLVQLLGGYKTSLSAYKGLKEEHAEQMKDAQMLTDQEKAEKEKCQEELGKEIAKFEKSDKRRRVFKTLSIVGGALVIIETAIIVWFVAHGSISEYPSMLDQY